MAVGATPAKSVGAYHIAMADRQHQRLLALDKLMLNHNSLEKGGMCEQWLRNMLREVLPLRFGVGWGHVSWGIADLSNTSPLDVIVYDQLNASPIFAEGDFVVVPPPALLAAVEVKAILAKGSKGEVAKACSQLSDARTRLVVDADSRWDEGTRFPGFVEAFGLSDLKVSLSQQQRTKHVNSVRAFVDIGRDLGSVAVETGEWRDWEPHGFAYWYWALLDTIYDRAWGAQDVRGRPPVPTNWKQGGLFDDE